MKNFDYYFLYTFICKINIFFIDNYILVAILTDFLYKNNIIIFLSKLKMIILKVINLNFDKVKKFLHPFKFQSWIFSLDPIQNK